MRVDSTDPFAREVYCRAVLLRLRVNIPPLASRMGDHLRARRAAVIAKIAARMQRGAYERHL